VATNLRSCHTLFDEIYDLEIDGHDVAIEIDSSGSILLWVPTSDTRAAVAVISAMRRALSDQFSIPRINEPPEPPEPMKNGV
jgi:hypothetical protein